MELRAGRGAGSLPSGTPSCPPQHAPPQHAPALAAQNFTACSSTAPTLSLGRRCRTQRSGRRGGHWPPWEDLPRPPRGPDPPTRCAAGRWRLRPRGSAPGHLPAPQESATGGRGRSRPGAGTGVSAGLTGRGGREGCGARGAEPGAGARSGSRAVSRGRGPGPAGAARGPRGESAGGGARPGFHGDAAFAASGDSWVAGRGSDSPQEGAAVAEGLGLRPRLVLLPALGSRSPAGPGLCGARGGEPRPHFQTGKPSPWPGQGAGREWQSQDWNPGLRTRPCW